MKPNTENIEKDREHKGEGKEHWEKGTTKTIGNVKRVVRKMFGVHETEVVDKSQKK